VLFLGQFVTKGYDVDGVMSVLVSYNRRPEDLPEEIATTVVATTEIVRKTVRTLFNGLSLLKLSPEIRTAIVPPLSGLNRTEGILPVSQGYLFAVNDCAITFSPLYPKNRSSFLPMISTLPIS
jgi:hypothetical protein